jgi:hypothetical protein
VRWVIAFALILAAAGVPDAESSMGDQRPPTLATFAGGWSGHDRGMSINRWGRGYEQLNSGAGCPCFGMAFQLSDVRGTNSFAAATATVIRLYGTKNGYPAPSPLPRIGQRGPIQLRSGIIIESLTRIDYCGTLPRAKRTMAPCGA